MDLTDTEVNEIINGPKDFALDLSSVVCKNRTAVGWTTWGHDGGDVPIWLYNCELGGRTIENTDIADEIFDLFNIDKKELNKYLFVNVDDVFKGEWILDQTDTRNPVLVITLDSGNFRLPIGKDELHYTRPLDGSSIKKLLSGLVVYAPKTNRVYIPQDAVDAIKIIASRI